MALGRTGGCRSWFAGGALPPTLAPAVRAAIWSVDKDQPVVRVATMRELVEASVADRRFALVVFEAFGVAALVLAAIGIYGMLSVSVTERTREIGVRSALGASSRDILALVLRQGMVLTGGGRRARAGAGAGRRAARSRRSSSSSRRSTR